MDEMKQIKRAIRILGWLGFKRNSHPIQVLQFYLYYNDDVEEIVKLMRAHPDYFNLRLGDVIFWQLHAWLIDKLKADGVYRGKK